jgi:hypothetical protein
VNDRIVRCRMTNKTNDRCTAEAADPNGELLICERHLALALELIAVRIGREALAGLRAAHADLRGAREETRETLAETREARSTLQDIRANLQDARTSVRQLVGDE